MTEAKPLHPSSAAPFRKLTWRPANRSKAGTSTAANRPAAVLPPATIQPPANARPLMPTARTASTGKSPIRQAADLQPADPFNNPFGDRTAQVGDPRSNRFSDDAAPAGDPLSGADAAPAGDPLPEIDPAPSLDEADEEMDLFRAPNEFDPPEDTDPGIGDLLPGDAPGNTPPADQLPRADDPDLDPYGLVDDVPGPKEVPCDHKPNNRNCCQEADRCREAWSDLTDHPLSANSIDITPSFKPDIDDPEEVRAEIEKKFGEMASRTWKDRNGDVVAEGRMKDFIQREVVIETDNGDEVRIPIFKLGPDDTCFVTAWWRLPAECRLGRQHFVARSWTPTTFTWTASAACHKPLYFEEEQHERYGHMHGPIIQPVLSGAHFFGSVLLLPYQMGMYPPTECMYDLGYYRPGNCAPRLLQAFPLSARGGAVAAGVAVGLPAIIP